MSQSQFELLFATNENLELSSLFSLLNEKTTGIEFCFAHVFLALDFRKQGFQKSPTWNEIVRQYFQLKEYSEFSSLCLDFLKNSVKICFLESQSFINSEQKIDLHNCRKKNEIMWQKFEEILSALKLFSQTEQRIFCSHFASQVEWMFDSNSFDVCLKQNEFHFLKIVPESPISGLKNIVF